MSKDQHYTAQHHVLIDSHDRVTQVNKQRSLKGGMLIIVPVAQPFFIIFSLLPIFLSVSR